MLFKERCGTDFKKQHKLPEHKCQLPAFLVTQTREISIQGEGAGTACAVVN